MAESSYDVIVIGSGPGGYVAAIRAAQLGKRTAVVERDRVGGRCLNYACIPAKSVLRSADLLTEVREAGDFGVRVGSVEVDFAAIQARREKVVTTLTSGVAGLFKKNGIDLIEGDAALTADGGVRVLARRRRAGDRRRQRDPCDRLGAARDPGRRARRPRDRHRGGVGAARAAEAPRGGGMRRLGRGDRLGVRPPRQRGDPARGRRPRAAGRGRRHLEARRARASSARASTSAPSTPIGDVQPGEGSVSFAFEDAARRGRLPRDRGGARRRRRGARDLRRRASNWASTAWSRSTARSGPPGRASTRSATSSTARRSRTRHPTRGSSRPRTSPGCRRIRSPTSTSRGRRSAPRTSAPSG